MVAGLRVDKRDGQSGAFTGLPRIALCIGALAASVLTGCSSSSIRDPSTTPALDKSSGATPAPSAPLATYTDPAGATARTCLEFQTLLSTLQKPVSTTSTAALAAMAQHIRIDATNAGTLSGNSPRYATLVADAGALALYLNRPGFTPDGPPVQAMQNDCG